MRLNKNFVLSEFLKSDTGTRKGIDNTPPDSAVKNLKLLVDTILQPVADEFKTVVINSGFRSPELNVAIGGATNSQHLSGLAADIEVPGVSNYTLACWIRDNLKFDQLILEYYTPGSPNSGWVHVSTSNSKLRNEVLTIGKTIRKTGLHA